MVPTATASSPASQRADETAPPPAPADRKARPVCVPMPAVEPDWDRIDGDI